MALNFPVIGLVIGVIWLSIDYLAADYFTELMDQYQIAPNEIHGMFLDSVHTYLAGASAVAILLAIVVSYALSNRVLRPLKEVSTAIGKMSAGDRDARARTLSKDELGDLAGAFNRMADQLNRFEQLRENMVVDVAHELRTPVTNIRGYVEGLRDQIISPSDASLKVLEKETLRLANLVESLLDLSRADAAEFHLNSDSLDISEAISTALEDCAYHLDSKNLTTVVDLPDNTPRVLSNGGNIQVILNNLIQNACQYSPADEEILIEGERLPGRLLLRFSNRSETILPRDLPLIFERFYRSEKSRSRNSGGAGIGLAIVKKLVDAHGGSVGANFDNGKFSVWLTIPDLAD